LAVPLDQSDVRLTTACVSDQSPPPWLDPGSLGKLDVPAARTVTRA
jgi:hypothetical protein